MNHHFQVLFAVKYFPVPLDLACVDAASEYVS